MFCCFLMFLTCWYVFGTYLDVLGHFWTFWDISGQLGRFGTFKFLTFLCICVSPKKNFCLFVFLLSTFLLFYLSSFLLFYYFTFLLIYFLLFYFFTVLPYYFSPFLFVYLSPVYCLLSTFYCVLSTVYCLVWSCLVWSRASKNISHLRVRDIKSPPSFRPPYRPPPLIEV